VAEAEDDSAVVGEQGIAKADPVGVEPELPPVALPSTKAPVQFNQQVNIYQQIPQSAWDRLNADQVVELSKLIVGQIDTADKRQFDYAIQQTEREIAGKKLAMICGSAVTLIGFGVAAYLGINGHEFVALSVSLPLATILAVIVGRRFLD
jgi:hypothetical protein